MNRFILVAATFVALSFLSCEETKEDVKEPLSEKDIYKTIGEQIPFETGMEWVEFYRKKKYEEGRLDLLSSYAVSAAQLKNALQSTTNLVGVAFHYAIDDAGQSHILVIPVDESLSLWSFIPGRIMVDANTGKEISQEIASAWAQNYKDAYPDEKWFHFFGKEVFDDMSAISFFSSMEIEPAINVLDLSPQLLLVVMNDDLVSFGRTADSDGIVYDASNACPPCAVR